MSPYISHTQFCILHSAFCIISRCGAIGSALALGARCCRFESCHFDHMKIIRTFSYLEKRSDYLFYSIRLIHKCL